MKQTLVFFKRQEGTLIGNVRIALANIRVPATPADSVCLATSAVADAGRRGAAVICFPECFVPGYRWRGQRAPSPDPAFLERAWTDVADAARRARVGVILGTERITERGLQISACVIDPDGAIAGWQDKTQLDPSEEGIYPAFGTKRRLFSPGAVDVRRGDLPRRLALSGNRTVGRASRCAGGVSSTRARRRTRELSSRDVRRSGQHIP